MELSPEQKKLVRDAFVRGKEAERQRELGLPVTVKLETGTLASDGLRMTPKEKDILTELKVIRKALRSASEDTRALLVDALQDVDQWLNRVEEYIHLIETSIAPEHIGDELVRLGHLTSEQAASTDFSSAGKPRPYSIDEAVEVLRQIWLSAKGSASPGGYLNTSAKGSGNYYRFNEFVQFVGRNLLELDPTLETGRTEPKREGDQIADRTGLENACYKAWLSLQRLCK